MSVSTLDRTIYISLANLLLFYSLRLLEFSWRCEEKRHKQWIWGERKELIICFKLLESSLEIYRLSRLYNSMNRLFINSTNDFSISKAKNLSRSRTNLHSSQMLTFFSFLASLPLTLLLFFFAFNPTTIVVSWTPGNLWFFLPLFFFHFIYSFLSLVIRIRSINSKEFFSLLSPFFHVF